MRSLWRTRLAGMDRELARDVALVCLADGIVGMSFGAIAVSSGLPFWLPMLLSLLVFAGASQFIFIGIVTSGGNPIAAVVAALLVNARHLPFGFAVGDVFGARMLPRIAGSHIMIDESVAFALAQRDAARKRTAFWTCGVMLFVCWNIGVALGALAGSQISDTAALGLDAAFPAVLLALLLPSLRAAGPRRAALAGAGIALLSAPFLPAGLPVLLALAGVAAGSGRRTQPADDVEQAT